MLAEIKVRGRGSDVEWRPGQSGLWQPFNSQVKVGRLRIHLCRTPTIGGASNRITVYRGKKDKDPLVRVINEDGIYLVGPGRIERH